MIPVGALFAAWCTLMAVRPIKRPRWLGVLACLSSAFPNQLPLQFLAIVVVSALPSALAGNISGAMDWLELSVATLTVLGLLVVTRRALQTGAAVRAGLANGLGSGWPDVVVSPVAVRRWRRLPWLHILFLPWPVRPRHVERIADIRYGDADDDSNLLDVYRHCSRPPNAPTFVYLHGGRFRWGDKHLEARALLYRLAGEGWTCISANYHLSDTRPAGFPRHLIDVKRVIAWVRTHGPEFGANPDLLVIGGSSAGAHLTAMAALTPNDPRFQPGFEATDTSVTAGIGLGGYYGPLGGGDDPPSTPLAYAAAHAPPFLVVHGENDTYTPAQGARSFVERLRPASKSPVVYVELPGGQHAFDLFRSVRFEQVVDGIDGFVSWIRSSGRAQPAASDRRAPVGAMYLRALATGLGDRGTTSVTEADAACSGHGGCSVSGVTE